MIYVLDTSSFLELQSYYPETFPSFWERFDELVGDQRVTSVSEVLKELENQATAQHLIDWYTGRRSLFSVPRSEEMEAVARIFQVPHFQQLIGQKQLARGMPVADPWLVARGITLPACVVTEEQFKPNAAKIPNVCSHFSVDCIKLQELMAREGWRF